jgi:glycosyltransferase involved in cell wall biosynthesis
LKILHINTLDSGGAAIAAKRLHLLLLSKGVDSKILFLKRSGNAEIKESYYFEDLYKPQIFRTIEKLNTAYNRRKTFNNSKVYFNGPDSLFNISKHPLFNWAEHIHFHWVVKFIDWQKNFSHKDKSFVWTLHDMNPFTGGEHYQTGYNDEFSEVSKKNIHKKLKSLKDTNLKIVTPSQWLGDLSSASQVFKDLKHFTIRNPIDIQIFKSKQKQNIKETLGLNPDKKTLMFVAENPHDVRKGLNFLKQAVLELPSNIEIAIVGNPLHVKSDFKNAFFAGSVHEESKLADYYNAADVFVIPSLEDNLPNTVSESLLCGTPVAGFKIGGIQEMVHNGKNGFLVSDFNTLSTAIQDTLEASLTQDNIRSLALTELNPDTLYKAFIAMYNA